jgi:ABC-type glycerol-3-phosphate transport system permease component
VREGIRNLRYDWPLHLVLMGLLLVSLVPLLFMLFISLKDMGQFVTQPLGLSFPLHLENYEIAFNVLKVSFLNSLIVSAAAIAGTLAVASLAAYAFARFRFPGREWLYWLIIAVLFIPGILTFATRYILVADYGLLDTYWVMIIPRIAGVQIFQIFVLRTFFASLPEEVLEAARVDGASVLQVLWKIIVPLSRPIMATLGIIELLGVWNDWLWPLITIKDPELRPMALQVLFLTSDVGAHYGLQMAGYVLATLPMLIIFALFSKQFIEGLSSGALKW